VLVGLGGFLWTLGHKLVKPTIFSIVLLTVFSLIMIAFYAIFLPRTTKEWTIWVIGGIAVILGSIAGYFLTKLVRIGVTALGTWVGVIISLLVHEAFMYTLHQQWLFWLMVIGFGIVFGGVSYWKYKLILMVATAFIGSYFMVRGVSLYIGGYPNEFTLINMAQTGQLAIHWAFYLYLGFIVVLTAGGVFVQQKIFKPRDSFYDSDTQDTY